MLDTTESDQKPKLAKDAAVAVSTPEDQSNSDGPVLIDIAEEHPNLTKINETKGYRPWCCYFCVFMVFILCLLINFLTGVEVKFARKKERIDLFPWVMIFILKGRKQ